MPDVAALYVRRDSHYKAIPGVECYDADRDARNYAGPWPVVAHPPCRAWSRLRAFAKPAPGEPELALLAVDQVRRYGGILEHPASSALWPAAGLPDPRSLGYDDHAGFTLAIDQAWLGHRARKRTWLYIVGLNRSELPAFPLRLGEALGTVHNQSARQRELTPPEMASWLVACARAIGALRAA